MGILTDDMRRVVEEQQLGFVATVCPDGTPNLSPKGTTAVLDADHLVFADICSPQTVENLILRPVCELNVVDCLTRKGYRFKGVAQVHGPGDPRYEPLLDFYRRRGSTSAKPHVVVVRIDHAAPLVSPAYDDGRDETQVVARWRRYWTALWDGRG
jgi:hypothetical protein